MSVPAAGDARPHPGPSTLALPVRQAEAGASWHGRLARPAVDLEVVVPAFNEERRIGPTLQRLAEQLARQKVAAGIVVVDNGSFDRTTDVVSDLAPSLPVATSLINCARPGKGAAVRVGVLTSHARYVGFCDADLATPPEHLDQVVPLLEAGAPVVIGSRRVEGAAYLRSQPAGRRLGSLLFHLLSRPVVRGVEDTQCGFKFFERRVAASLFSEARIDGFAFDLEILGAAVRRGLQIVQLPVLWSDQGGSTFRPLRDGMGSFRDAVKVAARLSW